MEDTQPKEVEKHLRCSKSVHGRIKMLALKASLTINEYLKMIADQEETK